MSSASAPDALARASAPKLTDVSIARLRAFATGKCISFGTLDPYSSSATPLWIGGEGSEVRRYWFSDQRKGDVLNRKGDVLNGAIFMSDWDLSLDFENSQPREIISIPWG